MGHIGTHLDTYEKIQIPLQYLHQAEYYLTFEISPKSIRRISKLTRFRKTALFCSEPDKLKNIPVGINPIMIIIRSSHKT